MKVFIKLIATYRQHLPPNTMGNTAEVDTGAKHTLGTRARDSAGNEYVYMTGVASTVLGSWVTYDELYITTLLAADAIGPVAVAMAAIDAS